MRARTLENQRSVRRLARVKRWGSLLTVGLGLLTLLACSGSGLEVMRSQQSLKDLIQQANAKNARRCAPVEMAKAEAGLSFAVVEMKQGDARRATDHLRVGDENVRAALKLAAECKVDSPTPPPSTTPKDSDGDGIVDSVDACPDRPEDFDGVEDDDGCPDAPKDRDADGIVDNLDRCPDQPEDRDGVEDDDGCPDESLDKDNDGIVDEKDQCPEQPEDKDGFQDEDGCPDVDNDADGIFDVVDKCPGEPEDVDGFEDPDGCPDPDNDRDGLADVNDKCPLQPESANGYMDEDGCPDTKPELPSRVIVTAEQIKIKDQIKFKTNEAIILKESYGILNDVAKVLKAYPKIKLRIEGHTDDVGSEVKNLDLSKRRAASVRTFLVKAGIATERLTSIGLGESQPIDTNKTPQGKANNRRVEFHITEQ